MKASDAFPTLTGGGLRPPARRFWGAWIGGSTVVVAAAVFFCEMHLTAVPIEQTLTTAAVMILCCFIMYTSLYDTGRQTASGESAYRELVSTYGRLREQICGGGRAEELESYCTAYVTEELTAVRGREVAAVGLGIETVDRYIQGELQKEEYSALSRPQRRAIRRAARLRPLTLSAAILLYGGKGGRRDRFSTHGEQVKRTLGALIPTVAGSLITVAVALEGIPMTPAAVVAACLRLFTVIWTGVRGYASGVTAVEEEDKTVLECKISLLRAFGACGLSA